MKTWQIYLLTAVIVVGGIGLMLWAKSRTTNEVSNSNQTATSEANLESTNSNQSMQESEATTPETGKNFVTLTFKGYGDVKIEMFTKDAPKTVANFVGLAEKGYYNNLTFHRMIPGFMIQGGDPTGTGSGGESIYGGKFEDELNPNTDSYKNGYKKGVVAMANAGPDTNGSQFFIMLADYPLPNDYTIFGKVVSGQEIVDKVGLKGSPSGAPQERIVIEKAVVSDK